MYALQKVAIDINFDQKRLRFIENFRAPSAATLYIPGKGMRDQMYLPLTFVPEEACLRLQLSIEGLPVNAIVDTGSSHSIGIRDETFKKLVAEGAIVQETTANAGSSNTLGGAVKFEAGHFTRGNLLGLDLKGCEVTNSMNADHLGMIFLINFNFIIDIPGKRFYFTRRTNASTFGRHRTLGLVCRFDDGHCYVTDVESGSSAESAGIRQGDVVLKLGSLQEKDLNVSSIYELCENAGRIINLEIARPSEKRTIVTRLSLVEK